MGDVLCTGRGSPGQSQGAEEPAGTGTGWGQRVPACSVPGTKQLVLRDMGEGDASNEALAGVASLESWLLLHCWVSKLEVPGAVSDRGSQLRLQAQTGPSWPRGWGQAYLSSCPVPCHFITEGEKVSELKMCLLPVGQGPGARGGQFWGIARRPLSRESLKGPRSLSQPLLAFLTGDSMQRLLILSVLLGAVLGKEDFVG